MVKMEAESNINDSESAPLLEEENLLSKFRIPIQNFEFSYIENCKDGKELEKILQVLRSGQEGHFPDLTKTAEKRLAIIKPKSKLLRTSCPVLNTNTLTQETRTELNDDLKQWVTSVSRSDEDLNGFKNKGADGTWPKIRTYRDQTIPQTKNKENRISATDYSSWEKYDPDTEILKMELQEENLKNKFASKETKPKKKSVQFKRTLTDTEAIHEANYEREKGNEFFRAGDFQEALHHYTNSINCKSTIAAYSNRAIVNIKLQKYQSVLDDCKAALAIDPFHIKSLLSKAQALENLKQPEEAIEEVEKVIQLEPNNDVAQKLAEKIRKQCGLLLRNTRLKIRETDTTSKKCVQNRTVVVPIPGTSTMEPPYYITCLENNVKRVQQEIIKASNSNRIIQIVSIDQSSTDDDDDGCTINHLKDICTRKIKSEDNIIETNKRSRIMNEERPRECIENNDVLEDILSPYSFLKAWNAAYQDSTSLQHAQILRNIDMNKIAELIGCNLDNTMLNSMLKCLNCHFLVPHSVGCLSLFLKNIIEVPRFEIISMLKSAEDHICINNLINFLNQHGQDFPHTVLNKLLK